MLAVCADTRCMLAMNNVCASPVQTTPSTTISIQSPTAGQPGTGEASATTGTRNAAAKAFCQNAMRVAENVATRRLVRTDSHANVNPEATPSASPRNASLDHVNCGARTTSPAAVSAAMAVSAPDVLAARRRSSTRTNSGNVA